MVPVIYVGIVGSRRRDTEQDKNLVSKALLDVIDTHPDQLIILVSGGCPLGADRFAEELAEELSLKIIIHRPDKSQLPIHPKKYDFAKINFARNTLIAIDSDILIACVASDRKGGTEDTIKKFKHYNKQELKVDESILVIIDEEYETNINSFFM